MDLPRRYWNICVQGSMNVLHSWRFSIRPERIGGHVDLCPDSRTTNEACCMHIRNLTAADLHCAARHSEGLEVAREYLAGAIRKVGQMHGVASKKS